MRLRFSLRISSVAATPEDLHIGPVMILLVAVTSGPFVVVLSVTVCVNASFVCTQPSKSNVAEYWCVIEAKTSVRFACGSSASI